MTTIADIRNEPERLGDATPADVEAFIEAVRICQEQTEADEADAIEYVWNDGDLTPRVIALLGPEHEWVKALYI